MTPKEIERNVTTILSALTKEIDDAFFTRKETLITVLCANDSPHIAKEFKDAGYKNVEILGHGFFEDLIDSLKEQDIA
jgi:hypothetical protein